MDQPDSLDRDIIIRDVNGIIKNCLKMPGSRGRIGNATWEKLNFHTSTA